MNKLKTLAVKLTIIVLTLTTTGLAGIDIALAQEPLRIDNIEVVYSDQNATISWQTNRPATGKIEYGLYSNNYHWSLQTSQNKQTHSVTIFGLFPETDYFFTISAFENGAEVKSFEQNFKTKKKEDNKSPVISKVAVVYTTGKTATIQWETNEEATTEIEYGKTISYGSTAGNNSYVKIHDYTINNLTEGALYHFRVKSKDRDNNTATWYDITFRTQPTNSSDRDELLIYDIKPTSENDINVSQTGAVINWRTNKLAEGWIRYGENTNFNQTEHADKPRQFLSSVTLSGLKSGTIYYYQIEGKDINGKMAKSEIKSFTTKSPAGSTTNIPDRQPTVLGTSSCDIDFNHDLGYFGMYYNLSEGHPDMQLSPRSWTKIARENDWYNGEYFSLSKVESKLNFPTFLPLNEGLPGDPFHFAVNWRAIINVPSDGFYSYDIASDDDSWVFIDDQLVTNLGGIHAADNQTKEVYLSAGYHKLEIYYAERSRTNATFKFNPDLKLRFHPLPDGCEVQDVIDYNEWLRNGGYAGFTGGRVLGTSTDDYYTSNNYDGYSGTGGNDYALNKNNTPSYACNPNLGYTKFTALYKTAEQPDVWAILETGQKHYISSPEAMAKYQCGWNEVKIVSKQKLNSYDSARLVRTPENSTIYYLFQRPETQWLKINIPSPTVFVSYPTNFWGNVARVDALDVNAYPDAALAKAENSDAVYKLEGSNKRLITSDKVFKNLGYDWAEVVIINQIHLDGYEIGNPIN